MGPLARVNLGRSRILDADLFAEESDLLLEPVILGSQADPSIDAVGRPAASSYDRIVGQGDDVQDG